MGETKSSNKWHKKVAEQLDKLNKDCNKTAGLQAVVKVAVGAHVTLERNIDTKRGLVNGAIGTFCPYQTGAYPSNLIMQMILVILRE